MRSIEQREVDRDKEEERERQTACCVVVGLGMVGRLFPLPLHGQKGGGLGKSVHSTVQGSNPTSSSTTHLFHSSPLPRGRCYSRAAAQYRKYSRRSLHFVFIGWKMKSTFGIACFALFYFISSILFYNTTAHVVTSIKNDVFATPYLTLLTLLLTMLWSVRSSI